MTSPQTKLTYRAPDRLGVRVVWPQVDRYVVTRVDLRMVSPLEDTVEEIESCLLVYADGLRVLPVLERFLGWASDLRDAYDQHTTKGCPLPGRRQYVIK